MKPETRHSIVLVIGTGATAALSVVYSMYAAYKLGTVQFSEFSAAIALMFLCNIALGPIHGTVSRFTAQYAAENAIGKVRSLGGAMSRLMTIYGTIALIASLALLKPLKDLLQFQAVAPLLVAFLMIYVTLWLRVYRGLLSGMQRFSILMIDNAGEAAFRLVIGVGLLLWIGTVAAGLCAYLVALVAVTLVTGYQVRSIWGKTPAVSVDGGPIKRFSVPIFVMMLTSAGFQNLDMLYVKHHFEAHAAGLYGAAFTFGRIISVMFTPFNVMVLPLLTSLYTHKREIWGPFARVLSYFVLLAAVPLILFSLMPEKIVVLMYGPGFREAAPLVLPVAGVRIVGYIAALMGLACLAQGRYWFLPAYATGFVLQLIAMGIWNDSPEKLIGAIFFAQLLTMLAMIPLTFMRPKASREAQPVE